MCTSNEPVRTKQSKHTTCTSNEPIRTKQTKIGWTPYLYYGHLMNNIENARTNKLDEIEIIRFRGDVIYKLYINTHSDLLYEQTYISMHKLYFINSTEYLPRCNLSPFLSFDLVIYLGFLTDWPLWTIWTLTGDAN